MITDEEIPTKIKEKNTKEAEKEWKKLERSRKQTRSKTSTAKKGPLVLPATELSDEVEDNGD